MVAVGRGTDSSNPSPSSGESRANLTSSIRALKFAKRDGVTRRYAWPGALVAGARCNPRLQLHRYDSPRLFPVGKGVVDDAGSDRRTGADADTDRRFRAVYPHIRRSCDSGCSAQRRINRRRHFRNSATVILTHCPPSARAT